MPNLFDMVDIVDDTNPLNIFVGNPYLKMATEHQHGFEWNYTPHSHTFNNTFSIGYSYKLGAFTRGYSYDTATGVRYTKVYNVDGNNNLSFRNNARWQFGAKKQFTLMSTTELGLARYADMIGIDMSEPELIKVNNRSIIEKLRLSWQIGKQSISVRADYTNRHTTSAEPGFSTIAAQHYNYGVSGVFTLPAGFGASTDFTCYTRRGYGSAALDTTDPIWNVRITYSHPRYKKWVFMADGFDILHRLSNVHYAVTASGRVVSYTNALPRYFLFSVQYRLNIQPKKH